MVIRRHSGGLTGCLCSSGRDTKREKEGVPVAACDRGAFLAFHLPRTAHAFLHRCAVPQVFSLGRRGVFRCCRCAHREVLKKVGQPALWDVVAKPFVHDVERGETFPIVAQPSVVGPLQMLYRMGLPPNEVRIDRLWRFSASLSQSGGLFPPCRHDRSKFYFSDSVKNVHALLRQE